MAGRPALIRKAEIERAVEGGIKIAIKSGLNVTRIDIEGAKVSIFTGAGEVAQESPLEAWRRANGQG